MEGILIASKLEKEGAGRIICRDLGINMDEWNLDITAYDWGVKIIKCRNNYCEEITINDYNGKGGLFDGTIFAKSNDELAIYKNVQDYRKGVRI